MSFKITQCILPLFHQNRQTLRQVFNHNPQKNSKYCTCPDDNDRKDGENLAAVLYGVNDLRMENRPIPKPNPNQVLLQMEVVGICGSDVKYLVDGKIGPFIVDEPMIIGHEASGTVIECGECVTNLKCGDKVAIEPQVACRKCHYCKTGNYHLCTNLYFCATPPDDGNLCRYYVHDSDFCHKLPCSMSLEEGTLMEPLAVAVHSCKRAKITSGDSVLVIGAGPIGLVSLLASKAMGASNIFITDIDEFRLRKAMELGADCGLNVKGLDEKAIVKKIEELAGGKPNKTIECCGFDQALRVGLFATKSGGKLVLAGMGKDNMSLPISEVIMREVDVLGVFRYVNDYPTAIDMVYSGKIDVKPLITHHFKLEDTVKAFEAAQKKEETIKIMIHANKDWKQSC